MDVCFCSVIIISFAGRKGGFSFVVMDVLLLQ